MKLNALYACAVLLFLLSGVSIAITLSCSSGDGDRTVSIGMTYDLDSSTSLEQHATLGDSSISSVGSIEGRGTNLITHTVGNNDATITSSINSKGSMSSIVCSYASGDLASTNQKLKATGQSESSVTGTSRDQTACQNSGVYSGIMSSSKSAIAGNGEAFALQTSSIDGALAYSGGEAQSLKKDVKLTGGLNGAGGISGFLEATASNGAKVSGSIRADSIESRAYSAVKSSSEEGFAYSYLSSDNQLASIIRGVADGHVITDQNLQTKGDVSVYAKSISEDLNPKIYNAEGDDISGSISASAGSPAVLDINLDGDIQSATSNLMPTPGSWVWNGLRGIITSNPSTLMDDQGQVHVFAKGADNSLWDNKNGNWFGLGGVITSDPCAVTDAQGKVHVLARGADFSLWDHVLGVGWQGLGGYITSNPSAALKLSDNHLKAVVKGGDNSLWIKDLTTGTWTSLGGQIASNPQVIFDDKGKMHVLARGSDGSLWDNVDGAWQPRGGYITSDAIPIVKSDSDPYLYAFVRGGDGSLWRNTLNTNTGAAHWQGFGGYISSADGSIPYKGNPGPVVDSNGKINVLVRGGDGSLWNNINDNWYQLGGYITSDPSAVNDPTSHSLKIAARGGDRSLWLNTYQFYALYGLDFSPYMDGQSPKLHTPISEDQLKARMKIIAPYTQWIRTYGCTEGLENAGRIAHEMGLKAAVGAWLTKDGKTDGNNDKQIRNLIQLAKAGQADMVIVGSEAMSLGQDQGGAISEDELIGYINQVRNEIPSGIPITYGFTYAELDKPKVVAAVDVVSANLYPFYADPNGISIDQAISNMDWAYYQYANPRAQGKQVFVSETGWPSSGPANKDSVPSTDNAARYFRDFAVWARNNNVPYFYFEAFDESWKAENPWGPFWGIWNKNGNLKPGMDQGFKA